MEDLETKENRPIHSWFEDRPRVNSKKQPPKKKVPLGWKAFAAFVVTFIVGAYIDGSFFEHSGSKILQIVIALFIIAVWTEKEDQDGRL